MTETPPQPPRSTFVTVVGWIFTALSGFNTLIAMLQTVMVLLVFSRPEVEQALQKMPSDMPPIFAFMFRHMWVMPLALLLVSAFTLACSIGLIRRWNWARLGFAGIMVLGVVWNLIGVVGQFFMYSFMQGEMQRQFQNMPGQPPDMRAFMIASAVFALGFSVLFGWIAKRLLSAPIAAEFRRERRDPTST